MKEKLRNVILIILFVGIILCLIAVSYSYFEPLINNIESKSTIKLDGAEIYANYTSTSTLYIEDVEPSDNIIGYKDFSLEVKNTSSKDVSAYIYLDILYSDYTDIANDGVLYYELVSDNTTIVDKTMIKAIKSGKALLYELVIPKGSKSTTINYRLNIYFPTSNKIQNLNKGEDGTMKFNGKIEILDNVKLIDFLTDLDLEQNNLEYDDFGNLRYVGTTPKNYIKFNNETWRIIGIVDEYVKIIRNDSIGDYEWNSKKNIPDWTISSLKEHLNGIYYNSLRKLSQSQIANVTWHLGGWNSEYVSAANMYKYERGIGRTGTIGEDYHVYSEDRETTWQGNIALMYPSDYGYASKNTSCRSSLYSYSNSCSSENWLYEKHATNVEWLLTPSTTSSTNVFAITVDGNLTTGYMVASHLFQVRPSLYLTNETTRISGTGTSLDPYIIG